VITVESLTKRYGRTTAVDGLSFIARGGRITALLGPAAHRPARPDPHPGQVTRIGVSMGL
jgi:hypothetical protein